MFKKYVQKNLCSESSWGTWHYCLGLTKKCGEWENWWNSCPFICHRAVYCRISSLEAIVTGVTCTAVPADGATRTSACRRSTSPTLDRGAMTVTVVLGAGAGCPLQRMEEVAATTVILLLDIGSWRHRVGDGACAFQDGEEVSMTTVPYFRTAARSCRRRCKRRRGRLLIAGKDTIACVQCV